MENGSYINKKQSLYLLPDKVKRTNGFQSPCICTRYRLYRTVPAKQGLSRQTRKGSTTVPPLSDFATVPKYVQEKNAPDSHNRYAVSVA